MSAHPETVLVVEDEVLVRLSIAEYLRDCGYAVIEAVSSDEAQSVFASGAAIDIVFSDIDMPTGALDGFSLAEWMHEHHPDVAVILTSGFVDAQAAASKLCNNVFAFVPKPYAREAVGKRIITALEQRRAKG